jgi:hypothetical protein
VADFHRTLKNNKILVFFMIFTFLYMSCFSSCARSNGQDRAGAGQPSGRVDRAEQSEEPCGCPPAEQTGGSQLDKGQIADRLARYHEALVQSTAEIPRDSFDPRAIMDKIGHDPKACFQWVRDNTSLVPYKGVLRGPRGVLMDRLGNSLDRALLLSTMLKEAGREVRLAHALLAPQDAGALLDKISGIAATPPPAGQEKSSSIDAKISEQAAAHGLKVEELRSAHVRLFEDSARFSREAGERAVEQSGRVREAVGDTSEARGLEAAERRAATEALKDHWWVQVLDGSAWLDLDASSPDMNPGQVVQPADKSVLPDALPQSAFHSVEIRLLIERLEAGRLIKSPVLECSVKPFELMGEGIYLDHYAMNWPENESVFSGKDGQDRLKELVLQQNEWLPVLRLGSKQVTGGSFSETGEINKRPGQKSGGGIGGIAGGIFGALGGGTQEKPQKESALTAEWIEYRIEAPGKPVRIVQRQLFDLIGPSARKSNDLTNFKITESGRLRRGLAMLAEVEIVLQVCGLSPEYVSHVLATKLLSSWDALSAMVLRSESQRGFFDNVKKVPPLPGPVFGLAAARREWSPVRDQVYFSCPNILTGIGGVRQTTAGDILSYKALDIVDNSMAVLPGAKLGPFQTRLQQGVLDTNAEDFVLSSLGKTAEGTAALFAQSRAQGVKWLTIRDPRDGSLAQLGLSDDTRARIEADLSEGYVVLAPQKPVRSADRSLAGWWRIDPKNGQVLGLGESGWGQGLTEHKLLWGFKIAAWTLCVVEIAMGAAEQNSGETHAVTGAFIAACLILGMTSAFLALCGVAGAAPWVIVIVEIQSFFMGLGIHLGMSQNSEKKK